MSGGAAGSPREEAERLVASLMGAAAVAIQGAEARRQLKDIADRLLGSGLFGPPGGASVAGEERHPDAASAEPASAEPSPGPGRAGRGGYATGAAECCLCPLCRVIAALRDPSPEFAERLASGAGDLAVGLTGLLRAFGSVLSPRTPEEPRETDETDPWRAATRAAGATRPGADAGDDPRTPSRPMAKKAVRKVATPGTAGPDERRAPDEPRTGGGG